VLWSGGRPRDRGQSPADAGVSRPASQRPLHWSMRFDAGRRLSRGRNPGCARDGGRNIGHSTCAQTRTSMASAIAQQSGSRIGLTSKPHPANTSHNGETSCPTSTSRSRRPPTAPIALVPGTRPGRSMNVIALSVIAEVRCIGDAVVGDADVKGVSSPRPRDILRRCRSRHAGNLQGASSPTWRRRAAREAATPAGLRESRKLCSSTGASRPVESRVAAIKRTSSAAGFELASPVIYRIASDAEKAASGLPEVRSGCSPRGGTAGGAPCSSRGRACNLLKGDSFAQRSQEPEVIDAVAPAPS